jgi:hypothetical protein
MGEIVQTLRPLAGEIETRPGWHETLRIVWDDDAREFTTIDCKACNKNEWKASSGKDPGAQYRIEPIGNLLWRITCQQCGRSFENDSGTLVNEPESRVLHTREGTEPPDA